MADSFPARYPGRCARVDCGEPFAEGDPIRRSHDSSSLYVHAVCPPEQDDTPPPTQFEGTTLDQMGY